MNKVQLMGRLTRDPEVKETASGKQMVRFTLAIDYGKDKAGNKLTNFVPCMAWEKRGLVMGQPVKIYDLAESMIKLSGLIPGKDIEIIETGLRPGEKLYEELLVQSDSLTKTDNELIFIEKDEPVSMKNLEEKLALLEEALMRNDDDYMREIMHIVVPTFKKPEEVNAVAEKAKEMNDARIFN